ncbi:MAG TPA: AraC family transcriptional regulator [Hyphomicrobiaceae bacterium]|nr:AraC family transcriptional regulator [Hyphomicrobiaceae bacterium]
MDALSDVLRVAHLTGGVFLHADFFAPWCLSARVAPKHCAPNLGPASHLILYHYVVEGNFRIRVEGEDNEDLVIGTGEVVLLPRNDLHLMGSDLSLPPVPGSDIIRPPKNGGLSTIHHGGEGARTRMICGYLGCAGAEGNPVISTLPPLLKLNVEQDGAAEWIRSTFQYAAEEVTAGRPGSEAVLAKLSELLFVEAVRRYAEVLPDGQTGWLAALREPFVARALALLHGDIARRWTVDDLGREVGLPRSALADRFIRLIDVPPMHYLASWRMQVASQKLRNANSSLAQVAEAVGYDSEAAFSRAFKKAFGVAPATWRRPNS